MSASRRGRAREQEKAMQIREPYQVDEFKVVDDQENEYTLIEYRNATETRSLKLLTVGPSWFALADGTPVDQIDDEAFRIGSRGMVVRMRKPTHRGC
jgi:hypothetical protein